MPYLEDVKKVFGEKGSAVGGAEISLYHRSAVVVSCHRGLLSISPNEVAVRLKGDVLRVQGEELRVEKASASEVYVLGRIDALFYESGRTGGDL